MPPLSAPCPIQNVQVLDAEDLRVCEGANTGDALSVMEDIHPDDVYMLSPDARPARLALRIGGEAGIFIAPDTERGRPGAELHLDCAVLLMSGAGQAVEAIVMVELKEDGETIAAIHLLPLAPLVPRIPYRVVTMERGSARQKFAQIACVSFSRGTRITLATGAQVPIEELRIGDRVLTRDDGAQEVRWIGQTTLRASGDLAPIVIRAGTLNNTGDLVVSPDHRLFVYQRTDRIGAGKSDLLVKARHLVNGETVFVQDGGYVDYFQILFDRHHIIYAEGIAAESMLIDPRTGPALPPHLLETLSAVLSHHGTRTAHGLDVQRALLDRPDALDLLKAASQR